MNLCSKCSATWEPASARIFIKIMLTIPKAVLPKSTPMPFMISQNMAPKITKKCMAIIRPPSFPICRAGEILKNYHYFFPPVIFFLSSKSSFNAFCASSSLGAFPCHSYLFSRKDTPFPGIVCAIIIVGFS